MTNTAKSITAQKNLTKCLVPHEECQGKYFDTLGLGLEVACLCSSAIRGLKLIKIKIRNDGQARQSLVHHLFHQNKPTLNHTPHSRLTLEEVKTAQNLRIPCQLCECPGS